MELVAMDTPLAEEVGPDPLSQEGTARHMRQREMARARSGAQMLGLPFDDLSKRQRRLVAAVSDLPEPFGGHREVDGTVLCRHLSAVRARLDWLVRIEEQQGDSQRGAAQNRAERNAFIFFLGEQAERAGAEGARPVLKAGEKYARAYNEQIENTAKSAVDAGYVLTDIENPGLLMHRNADAMTPLKVPVAAWFAVRAFIRGKGN
mgnify:CR=1 FL=1